MKKIVLILILITGTTVYSNDQFNKSLSLYKAKKYQASYNGFKEILSEKPNRELAYRCLYYMGKINLKNNRYDDAISNFKWVAYNSKNSKITKTSQLNIFKILHHQRKWDEILTFAKSKEFSDDLYNKILPILSKANWEMSKESPHLNKIQYVNEAIRLNNLLYKNTGKNLYKHNLIMNYYALYMSKTSNREEIKNVALKLVNELQTEEYFSDIQAVKYSKLFNQNESKKKVEIDATLGGNYKDSIVPFGDISLSYIKDFDKNKSLEFEVASNYDHNDYRKWVNKNSISLNYSLGSSETIKNNFGLKTSLNTYEKSESNNYSLSLSNDTSFRFNKLFRLSLDNTFTYKVYPEFTSKLNNNKLDHYSYNLSPSLKFYFSDLSFEIRNQLVIKQYLQSKFENSNKNRLYFNYTPELFMNYSKSIASVQIKGFLEMNKSYNYKLYGINNYNDYITPGARINFTLQPTNKLKLSLNSEYSKRFYNNQEAKDSKNQPIGKKRVDDILSSELELNYGFNKNIDLFLNGTYLNTTSNMEYKTNTFTNQMVFKSGVKIRL